MAVMIFYRPIGRFFEWLIDHIIPPDLRDRFDVAPWGLGLEKSNLLAGGLFIIFGCVYVWVILVLT
ncbi:hypothetical protein ACQEVI_24070 [Promicromonospora sp. CA-289599]|uniref:hypothetical protein n=1 Tax=Promicromonospora sp. CA-289599 TaxID=3240014 RepID=UPI003D8EDA22